MSPAAYNRMKRQIDNLADEIMIADRERLLRTLKTLDDPQK